MPLKYERHFCFFIQLFLINYKSARIEQFLKESNYFAEEIGFNSYLFNL